MIKSKLPAYDYKPIYIYMNKYVFIHTYMHTSITHIRTHTHEYVRICILSSFIKKFILLGKKFDG